MGKYPPCALVAGAGVGPYWWRLTASAVFEAESIEDIIAEMALSKMLDVGVKRDTLVEMLMSGWQREPGESLADLVNAVSSAHLVKELDQWRRQRFEEAAGLLVPVLVRRAAEA
jgi:hypothetical protein